MEDSIDVVHATTGTTAIPSYRPDAKERRYDRQLRLWASAGQRSLEAARVLLIGCDATGCQALKNLILPGIAHFTILSPLLATPQDVATNFFLHPESVNSSIAVSAVNLLKELNPAVEGEARQENPAELLEKAPSIFTSFNLIITSNVEPTFELALSDTLWEASESIGGPDIPIISVRNSGFIGKMEIQQREHCIADTHPDTTHTIRIDRPFPALAQYANSLDLEAMDSMEHSHIPWIVLLVRAASMWKESHNGILPREGDEYKDERTQFKKLVESLRKKPDEENIDEALAQAYRAWQTSMITSDLAKLLEEPTVMEVSANSKNLHILLNTLKAYLETPPHLSPHSPTVPDMHSSTASFIALQNLYRKQYQDDLAAFTSLLKQRLVSLHLPEDAIPAEEVAEFVKNTGGVGLVKGTKLRERRELKGKVAEYINDEDGWYPDDNLSFSLYLAMVAAEQYYVQHQQWPGRSESADTTKDCEFLEKVLQSMQSTLPRFANLSEPTTEAIAEVVRGGFSCLPPTAAFLGGLVAQEAIKLVTKQYVPLDNTAVINLVKSELEKFEF